MGTDEQQQQAIRADLAWLVNSLARVRGEFSAFSPEQIAIYIARELRAADDGATKAPHEAVDGLLAQLGCSPAPWSSEPDERRMPMIGASPTLGLFVVHAKRSDGVWNIEARAGMGVRALPRDACFSMMPRDATAATERSARSLLGRVVRQQRPSFVLAAIATVVMNVLALLTSLYSMQVYDRVIPSQGLATLAALTTGVIIAIILEFVAKFVRASIMEGAVVDMDIELSHRIFERLLRVRLDQFPASVGTLSAQLRNYEMLRGFASTAMLYLFVDMPFALVFLAGIAVLGGAAVALVPVLFLVVALSVGLLARRSIEAHAKKSMAASNRKLGLLVEVVNGAETIKASGSGWQFLERWNALTRLNVAEDKKLKRLSEHAGHYATTLQQLSYVALVGVGAYLAATSSSLSSGSVIACSILSGRVFAPIGMLPSLLVQWANAKSALESLERVFALKQDNDSVERPICPGALHGEIAFDHVDFSYAERSHSLRIDRLLIKRGERVGVIGLVGSGKSTLLKLMSGTHAPQNGRVLIDGLDYQHVAPAQVSANVGYLPQSVKLFSGTLRDNLTLGTVALSDEQVIAACQASGLMQLVSTNQRGLDMRVGENGIGLSGGQIQQVAMARLLLARPRVWLLDEPTASMDEATEARNLAALQAAVQPDQTLVVVTHKSALLGLVDRLIVLTPAGIVLDGPRDEVMRRIQAQSASPAPGHRSGERARPPASEVIEVMS